MGQKVHPKIFRTGIIYSWPSKWFSTARNFPSKLKQDVEIRRFLIHKLREASVDKVEIERDAQKITVTVYTAKPGLIIGRGGAGAEDLKKEINLNINEVDRPNLSAPIVMQAMVLDIEKRLPYKRVMKQAIMHVQRAGALGVKALVKGRLNGAEIAREEKMVAGKIPLHTLRADIDYAQGTAHTTYGSIGVKVWIYRGEIFSKEESRTGEVVGRK